MPYNLDARCRGQGESPVVNFRLTNRTLKQLNKVAKAQNKTLSILLREVIDQFLKNEKNKKKPDF